MSPTCEQHDLVWNTMSHEITEIKTDIKEIKNDIKLMLEQKARLEETVETLKKVCYGAAGTALLAIAGAIIRLVIK